MFYQSPPPPPFNYCQVSTSYITLRWHGAIAKYRLGKSHVNQRSKKEAKLFMPPQWGETLHQVAFLFKITLLKMNVFLQEHMKLQ